MALGSLSYLDKYKAAPFPPGYPADSRTFYAPVDNIRQTLVDLVASASNSLVLAMYDLDDANLTAAVRAKLANPNCFVQITLDSSRAASAHEHALLVAADFPASSIAIGRSERNAIMHLKMLIVDGLDVVTGSTNWSVSGETMQDNQLTVTRNALVAAEARSRIDAIHTHMLQAAAATPLTPN